MCAPRRAAAVVRPRGREKSADRRRRILISRLLIIRASVPRWKSPFPAYFKGFPAVSPLIPPYPAFLKYPVSPQSGTLELCFDRLHKYYDKSAKTHAKLVSTLTYPVLVLIVAAIVFMVIMLFAVPMFTSAFAELGSDLPPITRGLIAVSDFFLHYWWVFVLMILAFCIVRLLLRRSDQGRMFLAAGKLKRSPLKRLHQINASAQFASTMATMLAAGLPVTRSLEVTAGVINNYLFSDSVRRVRQGVEQGRDLAGCMAADPTFPRLLTEMTGVGERSGNMEQTLTVIGDYFDNEVSVTTQRLLSLMEPVITIALAVITVILLLAVYLPMFTMYGSIA